MSKAVRFHLENIVAAITLRIDPLTDGITQEGRLDLSGPGRPTVKIRGCRRYPPAVAVRADPVWCPQL